MSQLSAALLNAASKCKPIDVLSTSSSIFPLHVIGAASFGLLYASKIHHACADTDTIEIHFNMNYPESEHFVVHKGKRCM